jgi:molybdopterin-binding protein
MKSRARNLLQGQVTQGTPGAVHTEVMIAVPGSSDIILVITQRLAERLQVS